MNIDFSNDIMHAIPTGEYVVTRSQRSSLFYSAPVAPSIYIYVSCIINMINCKCLTWKALTGLSLKMESNVLLFVICFLFVYNLLRKFNWCKHYNCILRPDAYVYTILTSSLPVYIVCKRHYQCI